jgi:hypothetical protein
MRVHFRLTYLAGREPNEARVAISLADAVAVALQHGVAPKKGFVEHRDSEPART